ncbi:Uncharacterised protein [Fusobacterium necrogenes]|uniref:Uncharacterized protein n=2 Tax=Fusobacterium necrogenes TaxID=858 RepID=A0A377GZ48_9FUSO|nr:Uncharacterised protein [Fusobacterium necrogenes]
MDILAIKRKKYIQISIDGVYVSLSRDYIEAEELHLDKSIKRGIKGRDSLKTCRDKFFTEKTPLYPRRSLYLSSKASGDIIVKPM